MPKPDSDSIYNAIENEFIKNEIPWLNLVGICTDGAAVMRGKKNSVI